MVDALKVINRWCEEEYGKSAWLKMPEDEKMYVIAELGSNLKGTYLLFRKLKLTFPKEKKKFPHIEAGLAIDKTTINS